MIQVTALRLQASRPEKKGSGRGTNPLIRRQTIILHSAKSLKSRSHVLSVPIRQAETRSEQSVLNMAVRSSFPAILQSPINCGAVAMLAGLVIVPVVSAFTGKPDAQLVENAFACYNKTTEVPQKTALGE